MATILEKDINILNGALRNAALGWLMKADDKSGTFVEAKMSTIYRKSNIDFINILMMRKYFDKKKRNLGIDNASNTTVWIA